MELIAKSIRYRLLAIPILQLRLPHTIVVLCALACHGGRCRAVELLFATLLLLGLNVHLLEDKIVIEHFKNCIIDNICVEF